MLAIVEQALLLVVGAFELCPDVPAAAPVAQYDGKKDEYQHDRRQRDHAQCRDGVASCGIALGATTGVVGVPVVPYFVYKVEYASVELVVGGCHFAPYARHATLGVLALSLDLRLQVDKQAAYRVRQPHGCGSDVLGRIRLDLEQLGDTTEKLAAAHVDQRRIGVRGCERILRCGIALAQAGYVALDDSARVAAVAQPLREAQKLAPLALNEHGYRVEPCRAHRIVR